MKRELASVLTRVPTRALYSWPGVNSLHSGHPRASGGPRGVSPFCPDPFSHAICSNQDVSGPASSNTIRRQRAHATRVGRAATGYPTPPTRPARRRQCPGLTAKLISVTRIRRCQTLPAREAAPPMSFTSNNEPPLVVLS